MMKIKNFKMSYCQNSKEKVNLSRIVSIIINKDSTMLESEIDPKSPKDSFMNQSGPPSINLWN